MGVIELLNRIFPPKAADPHKDLGRNEICYCGSGKKYKSCHLAADERKRLARRN